LNSPSFRGEDPWTPIQEKIILVPGRLQLEVLVLGLEPCGPGDSNFDVGLRGGLTGELDVPPGTAAAHCGGIRFVHLPLNTSAAVQGA
jgi:hypothetical protein